LRTINENSIVFRPGGEPERVAVIDSKHRNTSFNQDINVQSLGGDNTKRKNFRTVLCPSKDRLLGEVNTKRKNFRTVLYPSNDHDQNDDSSECDPEGTDSCSINPLNQGCSILDSNGNIESKQDEEPKGKRIVAK
jgi:hypothetical protein